MIYEKYRPHQFRQIVGQDKFIPTLQAQSKLGEFAHSYLLFGQSGSGKTSVARIMAMAMNCSNILDGTGEPCGECQDCRNIRKNSHWDVMEVDAGRFRGIDSIKELCFKAYYAPISKKKVYILDECQQLTGEAWGSLLKLLEEPPPHLCLILTTTNGLDDSKIPETVISRCELYAFVKLRRADLEAKLKAISQNENVELPDDWYNWVSSFAGGNLRLAESELGKQLVVAKGG